MMFGSGSKCGSGLQQARKLRKANSSARVHRIAQFVGEQVHENGVFGNLWVEVAGNVTLGNYDEFGHPMVRAEALLITVTAQVGSHIYLFQVTIL
jgi:hypothetical protein